MKDVGQLKSLSAFEWASVSQYIVYISSVAGLKEFNSSDVISFPLAKIGPVKLVARKVCVLAVLEGNKKQIEMFVGKNEGKLEDGEMSVLRGMYLQFVRSIETVEEHIRAARLYLDAESPESFLNLKEMENDLPF